MKVHKHQTFPVQDSHYLRGNGRREEDTGVHLREASDISHLRTPPIAPASLGLGFPVAAVYFNSEKEPACNRCRH
ncbi:hypothetical protein SAY86_006615 [Trapa natans]|uniref:Uncharacterized protein n=1 Tax=Trapa natans TaxID=22666 RepID=A0AAN7QUE4_TRANT|nr:hypothetical protein SAY86_006615 [Trapa natans]